MDIDARPARADDVALLTAFVEAASAEIAEMRGGPVWLATLGRSGDVGAGLAADIASGSTLVVLGTIDGAETAYGAATIDERPGDGPILSISDLWVMPAARGVGVGEAVMDELLSWGRARGVVAAESTVLPGNRHGKNFFERYGLVARSIVVRRDLGDAPS